MFDAVIGFIKSKFPDQEFIPLHEPRFAGNEKKYVNECIDSGFVSSVGEFVQRFESAVAAYAGAKYGVAVMNGTSALHLALRVCGVSPNDEVLTQAFTFVGTVAPITYQQALPVFVDISKETLGMCPKKLSEWLQENSLKKADGYTYNRVTKRRIKACVPMHTFGHPCEIDKIVKICEEYNIEVIEDAAESIGSSYQNQTTGTFGRCGVLSFNGNKTITCGGGGMILTNDQEIAREAKHLSTTAKSPHPWEYIHDQIGYNYRLTNMSAALGLAQLEQLNDVLKRKRKLAADYYAFFADKGITFFQEPKGTKSNYWLNTLVMGSKQEREVFLKETNENGVMTRPAWRLIHTLEPYKSFQKGDLSNSEYFADRIVNIPSSVI